MANMGLILGLGGAALILIIGLIVFLLWWFGVFSSPAVTTAPTDPPAGNSTTPSGTSGTTTPSGTTASTTLTPSPVSLSPCSKIQADPNWATTGAVPVAQWTDGTRNTAIVILGNNGFGGFPLQSYTNAQLYAIMNTNCTTINADPSWAITGGVASSTWSDGTRNTAIVVLANSGLSSLPLQAYTNAQLALFFGTT